MKKRRIQKSIRLNIILSAFFSLIIACIVSCAIVMVGIKLFYHGELTHEVLMKFCLLACGLLVIISGIIMWNGSKHLVKPILIINEAVKSVAEGNFSVQIPRRSRKRAAYEYRNEIDELTENFNKMAKQLDNMDYMRKDFMSNVSHEIKTPVAAITGFTEILMEEGLSKEEKKEYLTYVNNESLRLSRLCESMLQMSRLDHQVIVETKTEILLDEQIRNCIIMLSEKWHDKEISYELNLEPCKIVSNYDLLYLVFTNLIDNAIKYSKDAPMLTVSIVQPNEHKVEVTIKDRGIGIDSEKLARIFEKFYQCEESHKTQGSGLGLSIVKRIIELLHGEILCESEEGIGTTMRVILPIK